MYRVACAAIRIFLVAIFLLLGGGCASSLVVHGFKFETLDSPGVRILDYRYGDSLQPGARARERDVVGETVAGAAVFGEMLRPSELYVKWRVLSTGIEYERAVNLKQKLPADIRSKVITFTVQDQTITVFLASYDAKPYGMPAMGPKVWSSYRVQLISEERGVPIANK